MPGSELMKEQGGTGTRFFANRLQTSEWLMAMAGQERATTVDRMRTDAIISAIENGFIQPIKQAQIQVAYDDPEAANDPAKIDILEFIKKNLSRINMSQALGQSALCVPYGFQVFEPVYEIKDGRLWLKKLAPRLTSTIWKWYVTQVGDLSGVQQQVWVSQDGGASSTILYPDIYASKLLVVSHKMEGSNFEGVSEYRSFYREWLIKDKTMKQLAVTIERVGGGIPIAMIDKEAPDTMKATDGSVVKTGAVDVISEVLEGLQGSENSYAALKWVNDIKMLTLDPQAITTMIDLVKYCDETMAKSAFQLFMNLGTSTTGSRALGQTFEDLYYESLYGTGAEISEAWNSQLIRRMVEYNFGPQDVYPKMSLSFQKNLTPVLQVYAVLKEKGLIAGNKDFENFVNDWFGLPATSEENRLQAVPVAALPVPALPASTQAAECACGHLHGQYSEVPAAKFGPQRKPTALEEACLNLSEITDEINTLINALAQDLRGEVQPALQAAAKDLGAGEKIYNVKISTGNKVADLFRKYYAKLLKIGREDVKSELRKQDGKKQLSEYLLDDTRAQSAEEFDRWVNSQANIDSELLNSDLRHTLVKYYKTAVAQGLTGAALTAAIMDAFIAEVGQRYLTSANSLTAAYSTVREIAAEEMADVIEAKVRTEIFDTSLCDYCREHDGDEYVYDKAKDDYFGPMGEPAPVLSDPAANPCKGFLGGNACRGIYLYKLRS